MTKPYCVIPQVWCGKGEVPDDSKYSRAGTSFDCLRKGFGAGSNIERSKTLPENDLGRIPYLRPGYVTQLNISGINTTTDLVKRLENLSSDKQREFLERVTEKLDGEIDSKAYNSILNYVHQVYTTKGYSDALRRLTGCYIPTRAQRESVPPLQTKTESFEIEEDVSPLQTKTESFEIEEDVYPLETVGGLKDFVVEDGIPFGESTPTDVRSSPPLETVGGFVVEEGIPFGESAPTDVRSSPPLETVSLGELKSFVVEELHEDEILEQVRTETPITEEIVPPQQARTRKIGLRNRPGGKIKSRVSLPPPSPFEETKLRKPLSQPITL